jgi:alkaline phosphatase D
MMALMLSATAAGSEPGDGPYQATGFKVGEVTTTTAIVWTRTTLRAKPNSGEAPMATFLYEDGQKEMPNARSGPRRRDRRIIAVTYPEGMTDADIAHAAPGTAGQTRVLYRPAEDQTGAWQETEWGSVDPSADFTRQIKLVGLRPGTRYQVRVETRAPDGTVGRSLEGGFQTAPDPDVAARVVFTVSTGQMFGDQDRPDGFQIYPTMLKLDPDFFVHTGDIVYYDRLAKTLDLAHWHWQRTYSRPTNVDFHRQVASYFIKDDHDTWINDCWPTMKTSAMFEFTFQQGLRVFTQQVPMGERSYRHVRWGKDLEIWLVEGRDFRSPNNMPDGPDKTIWGAEQKAWFKRTVQASDATFRVLISPTPIVGPDRDNKHDNHSNRDFRHEGDEIRRFLSGQKNLVVVCGDRHWQYHSIDPATSVREYSCGPASDPHAGGWSQQDFRPEFHRFLKVAGGFLSATVERTAEGTPTLTFRYHDVNGGVRYEDVLQGESPEPPR